MKAVANRRLDYDEASSSELPRVLSELPVAVGTKP
jgi:hypothetical protein